MPPQSTALFCDYRQNFVIRCFGTNCGRFVCTYVIVPDCPKSGSHSKSRSKSVNYVKFRVDGLYFVLFPVNGDSRTCGDRDELTETMPGKREILGKRLMRIYAAL